MSEVRSNTYVDLFTKPNEGALKALTAADNKLALERRSWEQSGAVEQMASLALEFYIKWGMVRAEVPPATKKRLNDLFRATLFGDTDVEKATNVSHQNNFSNISRQAKEDFDKLSEIGDTHLAAYTNATKPLQDNRVGIFTGLLDSWKAYATTDIKHLKDFSTFLTDEGFTLHRNEQEPFLVLLEQQRRRDQKKGPVDLIEATKRKAVEIAAIAPTTKSMSDFISELEGKEAPAKKGGNELIQWLRFASFPTERIDVNKIVASIQAGFYPGSFRTAFMSYIDAQAATDVYSVRQALSQHAPEPSSSIKINLPPGSSKKRRHSAQQQSPDITIVLKDEPEVNYNLATANKLIEDQDAVTAYVTKEVGESRSNPSLLQDLVRMVNVISVDPYIIGVRRLTKTKFLYYSAHENPTFKTTDPRTEKYRLVFDVVDLEEDGPNTRRVVVQDLLSHDKFDQVYKS